MVRGASAPPRFPAVPWPDDGALGDSARGADWAAVGCASTATGSSTRTRRASRSDLRGLTLLEAAAVGGETLAGRRARERARARRARRARPRRVAVAMSGGVDSAVTLLKAGPHAVGVTLRLWLDPHGPDAERACCSPCAVIAAREPCHARGLPARHARSARGVPPRGRRAVRPRLRARRDAEPVHPLQRWLPLRRAARVRAPHRCGAACDRPLRAHRRARRAAAARARRRPGEGSELHARRDSTRAGSRASGSRSATQTKTETRAEAAAAGLAAARPRREPGGVLPRGRRLPRRSSTGRGCRQQPARSSTRPAARSATHDGYWRFTPGQRRGLGVSAAEPLYALATDARTNTVVVGPRASLARRRVSARGRLYRARSARRGEAPLPLACRRGDRRGRRRPDSGSGSTSRPTASRVARPPFCTTATSSSVPGWSRRRGATRLVAVVVAFSFGDLADLALAVFLVAVGLGLGWAFLAVGRNVRPAFFVDPRDRT